MFTYFGDNRAPGRQLHDTPRQGNRILRWAFDQLHASSPQRYVIPPFFVFSKANPGAGRSVRFLGLAVPGSKDMQPADDLVAIWRTANDERFQNYKAAFTILDVAIVRREWIAELAAGVATGPSCPVEFKGFSSFGIYMPLESPRNIQYRTKAQQLPASPRDEALIRTIYEYFVDDPYAFEPCAVELWKMQADEPVTFVATRRWADGGRDAYGWYLMGPIQDRIKLEWSLEAKLYAPGNGAGVKETSRLISRLRHREFGVFVTTSYVSKQAYEELRGDQHPVVVIAAQDIVALLRKHGYSTPGAVAAWLAKPLPEGRFADSTVGDPASRVASRPRQRLILPVRRGCSHPSSPIKTAMARWSTTSCCCTPSASRYTILKAPGCSFHREQVGSRTDAEADIVELGLDGIPRQAATRLGCTASAKQDDI